jgi:phosphopantothenoylcysteine decarboxylase/phosphopantothenate--cysteine ligase
MDGEMWSHPATRANVARLRDDFGYTIVEPVAGELASGQSGTGRLAELPAIVEAVVEAVAGRPVRATDAGARPPLVGPARDADLTGRHVVVTAGGTREAIDPVRFLGNRSTGRWASRSPRRPGSRDASPSSQSTWRSRPRTRQRSSRWSSADLRARSIG